MNNIKRFNQLNEDNKLADDYFFTIKDLKKLLETLPDDAPVLYINGVGKGSNENITSNFSIADVNFDSDNGYGYYENGHESYRTDTTKTKGLLIHGK